MADTVPRTPEEDRPRLTREELDEVAERKLDGLLYTHGIVGIVLTPNEFTDLIATAQRTVAAEDEAARMAGDEEGHLNKVEQMRMRAEQAERTLAAIAEACEKYYGWGGMIEKDTIRRLLQEG